MAYQVALNSRNVLVPLSLEDHRGERMSGSLSRLDTATAMVIQVSAAGAFTQDFIPLRILHGASTGYAGTEWELWAQKAGSGQGAGDGFHAYYLGVPDSCFIGDAGGQPPRSLSVQVVGTSPLSGREEFSGGVDITMQAQVEPPLIPGFLNLGGRFFPPLLPHNFIEDRAVDVFEHAGKRQLVLLTALQMDPADRVPVSLEKHWDPKNWIHAVVENLAPSPPGGGKEAGYFIIKGGCFYGRNRKITHWFGGDIGLEERGFRQAATEKIRAMGRSGNGAWVFWLEPQGRSPGLDAFLRDPSAAANRRISIRHPMTHRLLAHPDAAGGAKGRPGASAPIPIADLPVGEAVAALGRVARILIAHQDALQSALEEPSHAAWSERGNPVAAALMELDGLAPARPVAERSVAKGLESDIRDLYRDHGETLRALESVFDETYGYSSWDAVGNPLRETLSAYLADQAAESRTPA